MRRDISFLHLTGSVHPDFALTNESWCCQGLNSRSYNIGYKYHTLLIRLGPISGFLGGTLSSKSLRLLLCHQARIYTAASKLSNAYLLNLLKCFLILDGALLPVMGVHLCNILFVMLILFSLTFFKSTLFHFVFLFQFILFYQKREWCCFT